MLAVSDVPAEEGSKVVVADIDEERARATVESITDDDVVIEMVERIEDAIAFADAIASNRESYVPCTEDIYCGTL
jgi:uncharacterized UPF0146 family protein